MVTPIPIQTDFLARSYIEHTEGAVQGTIDAFNSFVSYYYEAVHFNDLHQLKTLSIALNTYKDASDLQTMKRDICYIAKQHSFSTNFSQYSAITQFSSTKDLVETTIHRAFNKMTSSMDQTQKGLTRQRINVLLPITNNIMLKADS